MLQVISVIVTHDVGGMCDSLSCGRWSVWSSLMQVASAIVSHAAGG